MSTRSLTPLMLRLPSGLAGATDTDIKVVLSDLLADESPLGGTEIHPRRFSDRRARRSRRAYDHRLELSGIPGIRGSTTSTPSKVGM